MKSASLWGAEKIDRVLRRGSIDDYLFETVVARYLEQSFHRRIFVRAAEAVDHRPVNGVGENALLLLLCFRKAVNNFIEVALGVEHRRIEGAVGSSRYLHFLKIGLESFEAERLREPAGRVHRENDGLESGGCQLNSQRRGEGGFPDASRAAHHEHAFFFEVRSHARSKYAATLSTVSCRLMLA